MDDDGFALHSRRRGYSSRVSAQERDLATFHKEVPRHTGTSEDFEKAHAKRYGREEGLGPDGKHKHRSVQFPQGSDRQKLWSRYNASTKGRDFARDGYQDELAAATKEYKTMDQDERDYYEVHTGGLTPEHHERLDPRAKEFRDKSSSNARNREDFLRAHPHGYHSKKDHDKHYEHVEKAYGEYEYARDQQKHHERYRSYSNVDKRRDQYGRPMPHR